MKTQFSDQDRINAAAVYPGGKNSKLPSETGCLEFACVYKQHLPPNKTAPADE